MTTKRTIFVDGQELSLDHKDVHHEIHEWNGQSCSIQYFQIFRELPLGNHYHKAKYENFKILEGSGIVHLQPVNTDGTPIGGAISYAVSAGSEILVTAFTAHTFILNPSSKMVCRSNRRWDPKNDDLNPYKLV